MALVVTASGASSDAYDTLANGLTYFGQRGYCGTVWSGSPVVKGAVAADGTSVTVDGVTAGDTILNGDPFSVAEAPDEYAFTQRGVAFGGTPEFPALTFSPAAAAGFGDNKALTSLALTDEMVRRGTARLDEYFRMRLQGIQTTSGQALAWPRLGVDDEDGNAIASDTIPQAVKDAAFEMARIVGTEMTAASPQRIRSAGAGSAQVTFASGFSVESTLTYIEELMAPFLKSANRLVRA